MKVVLLDSDLIKDHRLNFLSRTVSLHHKLEQWSTFNDEVNFYAQELSDAMSKDPEIILEDEENYRENLKLIEELEQDILKDLDEYFLLASKHTDTLTPEINFQRVRRALQGRPVRSKL
jgi:hypothetical protein